MREIVLDTETTGLDPNDGHRIVEIGGIELWNRLPTGKVYHQYINPERNMPPEAFAVHGLSDEFLQDQPVFSQIAQDFMTFIGKSQLVIHNASFDIKFLNWELQLCNKGRIPKHQATDTLSMARKKFPGSPVSLDALCRRFNIDNSFRKLHGALLDSEILAEVYLELTGGRQPNLELAVTKEIQTKMSNRSVETVRIRPNPLPTLLTEEEKKAHETFISQLGEQALWMKIKL